MKHLITTLLLLLLVWSSTAQTPYTPSPENLAARERFADDRFGIFLHWGIYSLFAQGEWYLQNAGLDHSEYRKAASAFNPTRFNAREWVKAIKASGARYICFTTRHHDGFSMWETDYSDYDIVEATPYGRDILRELARECHRQGIQLHLYYSHIDWGRDDYPRGRTATKVSGRDHFEGGWPHYYHFMNNQITELLTQYGPIGAIWFDGWWDHDQDATPFDWQLDEQYALVHRLQPACLVANNHHQSPFPGEDIQIFERDLPGENKAGLSGQAISPLPLETCQTMNGMWGYKVIDQNYKSAETLIRYLVCAAGKGANLLLNIGPQPSGELPAAALERLKAIGEWMERYGETIYGTRAGDVAPASWGVTTRKGDRLFLHLLSLEESSLTLPLACKVREARRFDDGFAIPFTSTGEGITLHLPAPPSGIDYIIELKTE